jgi:hypothetical protein
VGRPGLFGAGFSPFPRSFAPKPAQNRPLVIKAVGVIVWPLRNHTLLATWLASRSWVYAIGPHAPQRLAILEWLLDCGGALQEQLQALRVVQETFHTQLLSPARANSLDQNLKYIKVSVYPEHDATKDMVTRRTLLLLFTEPVKICKYLPGGEPMRAKMVVVI